MKMHMMSEIEKLIGRYKKLTDQERQSYNEEQTKTHFIRPFFEALGWNFEDDVWPETDVSGQRVDYAFKLNGITKFFLEAKPLRADLDNEQYARQAINYAWNKGVPWAVLTDFEGVRVFNALAESRSFLDKLVFEITWEHFIEDFERLSLLSRESFQRNALDDYAIKFGKMRKRLTVNEKLFIDLKEARTLITEGFARWNKDISQELLEEGVQRILDRLVFIRVLEDRKLEDSVLMPILREWEKDKSQQLFQMLAHKFRELDDTYNSNLFSPHACEQWLEYSVPWNKIFGLLHGSQLYQYDFSQIPADILGGAYESYLSYIAQNPILAKVDNKKGRLLTAEDKGEVKEKSRRKRKEQGIYYTPHYIVDFIVQHTLGEKLREVKTVQELKKIKILDLSCGSGSFLTAALKAINEKYRDFGNPANQSTKNEIVLSNIYGVDLDPQAVELARLNLLIEILDQKGKLPLTPHVRVGNSLISGDERELKKYFGSLWRDKRPFNWQEEFPEVFTQGGFDVIIGNPPWVSLKGKEKSFNLSDNELRYLVSTFGIDTYRPNLFECFIRRGLSLLNEHGLFSFIVPDRLCANEQFIKIREYILENFTIERLLFKAPFPGIIGDTVIFVICNKVLEKGHQIKISEYPNFDAELFLQKTFSSSPEKSWFYIPRPIYSIFKKITDGADQLGKMVHSSVGFIAKSGEVRTTKRSKRDIAVLKGENIARYHIKGTNYFEFKKDNLVGGTQDVNKLSEPVKILLRKTGSDIIATLDEGGAYPEQSLYFLTGLDKAEMLFILGLLNSKLLNIYYKNFAITNRDATPQLKKFDLDKFPIIRSSSQDKPTIATLVKKMLQLNNDLSKEYENSEGWLYLKQEIERLDKHIDERVYRLFGLSEDEIRIINNS